MTLAPHDQFYSNPNFRLQKVAIIHRHGARTPIFSNKDFPNVGKWDFCQLLPSFYEAFHHQVAPNNQALDIHFTGNSATQLQKQLQQVKEKECFQGQLTDFGKLEMFEYGQKLRNLYVERLNFLDPKWETRRNQIYTRSTNYLRTIESLQFLLGGLYPKDYIVGLPRVVVSDTLFENMYPHDSCTSMLAEIKILRKSFEDKYHSRMVSLLNPLSFWHEMREISFANQTYRLYDMFSCMRGNKIALPNGVNEDIHGKLEGVTVDLWARLYEKDESFTRRAIGRFIPDIMQAFTGKAKLSIFSGHDSTLIPLMIAFEAYNGEYPGFASNVIFN
jgi:acid phosphatase